jgi:hypothetical protein
MGQVQQPDHPGLPLHQGADRRALVRADDEISFLTVACLGAVLRLKRPLTDGEHRLLEAGRRRSARWCARR